MNYIHLNQYQYMKKTILSGRKNNSEWEKKVCKIFMSVYKHRLKIHTPKL